MTSIGSTLIGAPCFAVLLYLRFFGGSERKPQVNMLGIALCVAIEVAGAALTATVTNLTGISINNGMLEGDAAAAAAVGGGILSVAGLCF